MLSGSYVAMALSMLRLRMEETLLDKEDIYEYAE
jgi:hypothetical protein